MTNTVSQIVSDETLDSIIQIESAGRPTIKAPTSSALGLGQFLNRTWLGTVENHRPDVMKGKSTAQVLAMRTDPSFSIEMLARFTEDNMDVVGRTCSPGDLYLAHFLGAGTAKKVYRSPRNVSAVAVCGPDAARANESIFYQKDGSETSCGQLRDWAASKMAKAGGKGWVKKYYKGEEELAEPEEPPALDEFDGDPDLRDVQIDLESMNYNPGDIDGLWGGATLGVLGAFILDRGKFVKVPMSLAEFHEALPQIRAEIDDAIAKDFLRPVKKSRKSTDTKDVAKIAPEVVPVQQGATWTLRGSIAALGTSALTFLNKAWDWLWNNHDNIPTDSRTINRVLGYFGLIPPGVYIMIVGVGLGALWYFKLRPGVQQITDQVNSGKRL